MNDLAKYVAHMTIAARAGLTPAQCLQRDLEQREAFEAWRREVDAVGESAEMDGHCPTCRSPSPRLHPSIQHEGEVCLCRDSWHKPTADQIEASERADDFNFAPECRELAAHFLPHESASGIDYMAQWLHECAEEYLAIKEEFRK